MITARQPTITQTARSSEGGWVLAASLVLSTLVAAVTVTYARHAVLAKKSLEFAKGASEVEEASRSGLQRVRERMRNGDSPGTIPEGTHDEATTPNGEVVRGERQVVSHDRREIRVRANNPAAGDDDEARIRARAVVVPGNSDENDRTRLNCENGTLIAGHLTVVSGDVTYQGVELAGLMLLEEGAHLTLDNCVLRGAILTRAGLCESNAPLAGSSRPRVSVYGGLRLLAGTELPDVAIAGPDLRFEADENSRVEIRGFAVADELKLKGRGCVRGMTVSTVPEELDTKVRRPGHGRGSQTWPESVVAGAERMTRLAFPGESVPESTLDAMSSCQGN